MGPEKEKELLYQFASAGKPGGRHRRCEKSAVFIAAASLAPSKPILPDPGSCAISA